ncbi:MAG: hypothetical protein NT079_03165 [Candidatus Omnitrophica bacterium]|nr:hypothetical protein [Candidatus Omnitrophota bacterium]
MRKIFILPSFERSVKKFSPQEKEQIAQSLEQFNTFLLTNEIPAGLGFKKISDDKYEIRSSIRLRVVLKAQDNNFYLVFVGNHDDIRRYLRDYR